MRKLFFQLVNQADPAEVLDVRALGRNLELRDGESGVLEIEDHVRVIVLEGDAYWPFAPGTAGHELMAIAIQAVQLAGGIASAGAAVALGELTVEAAAAIVLPHFHGATVPEILEQINQAADRYTAELNARAAAAVLEAPAPAPTETPPAEAPSTAMVWTGKAWVPHQVES